MGYYETLNLNKDATESEIKKAYRKLAMEYHPDKNPDDKGGNERFVEISEAYDILSNPTKKSQYDRFGSVDGQSHMNMEDVFSNFGDIFGGMGGMGGQRHSSNQNKGTNTKVHLKLNLEDVLNGVKRELTIKRKHVCDDCSGSGAEEKVKCTNCDGSGKGVHMQRTVMGMVQVVGACSYCNGYGYSIKNPCKTCHSSGFITEKETIEVEIPPGVDTGMQLKQEGMGNYIKNGIPGDLIILIEVEQHSMFNRMGNNLHKITQISIPEAILGTTKKINTLLGDEVDINIEPGTKSGKKYRIKDNGLLDIHHRIKGDLICEVLIYIPKEISDEERKVIEKLGNSVNFKN